MQFSKSIFTYIFIAVMMINAVGVAQVSHICKLAIAGIEKTDCGSSDSENHPCCQSATESATNDQSGSTDCCTDVIKYFHQKLTTTIQPAFKLQPLISCITFYFLQIPNEDVTILPFYFGEPVDDTGKSGKNRIIDLQTFLI